MTLAHSLFCVTIRVRILTYVCYAVVQVGSRSFGLPCSKEPVHDGQEGLVAAANECLALISLVGLVDVVQNAKEMRDILETLET